MASKADKDAFREVVAKAKATPKLSFAERLRRALEHPPNGLHLDLSGHRAELFHHIFKSVEPEAQLELPYSEEVHPDAV
jgi:hypothetical protein